MSIFVVSDTHFSHKNIITYCEQSRAFNNVEDMNEHIVEKWNSVVSPDDTVYHLGDCFMGPRETVAKYGSRLNGKIHVIPGNHDTKKRIAEMEKLGWIIENKVSCLDYNDVSFIMIHERPEEMCGDSANVILYGHVHDAAPKGLVDWTYHVGVDTNNLTPVNIHDIWLDVQQKKIELGE
jgi:calcineurin-like phosphoesterase family protein